MNQLQQLYLESLGQVYGLDRKYAEIAIKTALPSWDQVVGMVKDNKENLIAAGIGAAVAGGSSALYSTRKDWETEEEFRRRRSSSAVGAGLIGATVGGFASPVFKRVSQAFKGAPKTEAEVAAQAEAAAAAAAAERTEMVADGIEAAKDSGVIAMEAARQLGADERNWSTDGAVAGSAIGAWGGRKGWSKRLNWVNPNRASSVSEATRLAAETQHGLFRADQKRLPAMEAAHRKAITSSVNKRIPMPKHAPYVPITGSLKNRILGIKGNLQNTELFLMDRDNAVRSRGALVTSRLERVMNLERAKLNKNQIVTYESGPMNARGKPTKIPRYTPITNEILGRSTGFGKGIRTTGRIGGALLPTIVGGTVGWLGGEAVDNAFIGDQGATPGT